MSPDGVVAVEKKADLSGSMSCRRCLETPAVKRGGRPGRLAHSPGREMGSHDAAATARSSRPLAGHTLAVDAGAVGAHWVDGTAGVQPHALQQRGHVGLESLLEQ